MFRFRLGERLVDLAARTVADGGDATDLSPIEARLLAYLARRPGEAVGREELLTEVWGYRPGVVSRSIDKTVHRLRPKIEADPLSPRHLCAVYGQGLRLDGVVRAAPPERRLPRLIGREPVLAELAAAVRGGERALVVWGPTGAGKTRLADELASRVPLEVEIVDCTACQDIAEVPVAVAAGLELAAGGGEVARALASRGSMLLVLDACEGVSDGIEELVRRWLDRAPHLRILVTSRVAIEGARSFPLPPLSDEQAVELFVDRARLRDPSLVVHDGLATLVRGLDCLPLSIELAAARMDLLGLDGLLALIAAPLDLLASRRVSMAELLERSWRLLSPLELHALACAALFVSPFDLDDLAEVAGESRGWALGAVEALFRQSMLRPVEGEVLRYTLYAVIRERALPQAEDAPLRRYVGWFARFGRAELARVALDEDHRQRLMRSTPDIGSALGHALQLGLDEEAVQCAVALGWYRNHLGPLGEGLATVQKVQHLPCTDASRVKLALVTSLLYRRSRDFDAAVAICAAALDRATEPADIVSLRASRAGALHLLQRDDEAREELRLAEPHSVSGGRSRITWLQTRVQLAQTPDEIEPLLEEAIAVARRLGDPRAEASSYALLGQARIPHGRWGDCLRALRRALQLSESIPHARQLRCWALVYCAHLERRRGELDLAERRLEEVCDLARQLGDLDALHSGWTEGARIALVRGWHREAWNRLQPVLAEPGPTLSLAHGNALVALAEVEEARGDPTAAREAALAALSCGQRAHGAKVAVAMAHDLLALLASAPAAAADHLAKAGAFGREPDLAARQCAIAALIALAAGDPTRADAEIAEAERLARPLDLLPDAEVLGWIRRARRARRGTQLGQSTEGITAINRLPKEGRCAASRWLPW